MLGFPFCVCDRVSCHFIGFLVVGVMINKTGRTGEHPERRRLDYIKQVISPIVQKSPLLKKD